MLRRELAWQITGIQLPSQSSDEVFSRMLEQAVAFQGSHGRTPRPSTASPHEASLGRWLEAQRADARRGTLSAERRRMIDRAFGAGWAFDAVTPAPPLARARAME
ncbi:helicase associated domain-containing protein [Sinomonas humi]|nr:helicase associated domain-containing protein [Sinomonas humi]